MRVLMTGLELVSVILRLMNSDLEPDIRSEATGEIRSQYLSAEKARRSLAGNRSLPLKKDSSGQSSGIAVC